MINNPMPVMRTLLHKFLKKHDKLKAMTVEKEVENMLFPMTGHYNSSSEASITLPDGRVVTVLPEEKRGSYFWFFGDICQVGGSAQGGLIAVDYHELASLGGPRYPIDETVVLGAQAQKVVSDAQTE
jgi:hypothetical protein